MYWNIVLKKQKLQCHTQNLMYTDRGGEQWRIQKNVLGWSTNLETKEGNCNSIHIFCSDLV